MGSGIYSLGTRAMFASQAMLDTTAHNISNVNTPGYSRQQVELATEGGMYTGAGFFGRGVRIATITRSTNEFLIKEANVNTAASASDQTRLGKLEQLEKILPTGQSGLGYAATQFLNTFVDVSNQPQDMSARQVTLSRAQEWANRVNTAAKQLDQQQAGVIMDMQTSVSQVNSLTQKIAGLNQQIAVYNGSGHTANDLLDQRDSLIKDLNKLVQVNTVEADDGSLSVFMGGGQVLVLSNTAQTLQVERDALDATKGRVALVTNGTSRVLDSGQITGGALQGLLRYQDEDLTSTRAELNKFVAEFANKVNEIHSYGHRNVQGAALHPQTGELWTHEHGPQGGDEINRTRAGLNYGWPEVTYGREYVTGRKIGAGEAREGVEPPVLQFTPSIAPSGMAFYTGDVFPQWKGNLFVGALKFQLVARVVLEGDRVVHEERLFAELGRRIRDVRQGPDGHLWLVDETEGRILRLDPA